ncbi:hypothetical protein [Natronococcus wangiae]
MVEVLAETMPNAAVVWRCHVDLSGPSRENLAFALTGQVIRINGGTGW